MLYAGIGGYYHIFKIDNILMKGFAKILVLLLSIQVLAGSLFAQSKLERSKSELKEERIVRERRAGEYSSSSSFSDDGCGGFFEELIFQAALFVSYYSLIGSYAFEDHLYNDLAPYPLYNGISGNYDATLTEEPKLMRLDLENKVLLSPSSVYGNHLKAKFRPFRFLYLQTDYYQLWERNGVPNGYSHLSLFDFNLGYDRLRFERFNLGWTLGGKYVGNDVKKGGLSIGINAEVFLGKHFSLSSAMRWGWINSNDVNEFEAQLNYHVKNYYFTAGYEHLKIATPTYNFMAIGFGIYF